MREHFRIFTIRSSRLIVILNFYFTQINFPAWIRPATIELHCLCYRGSSFNVMIRNITNLNPRILQLKFQKNRIKIFFSLFQNIKFI